MSDYGCGSLEELLNFAPCCVEHDDKTYCLHFFKSSHGFIVEYSLTEEKITVGLHGVNFISRQNLFDTYRRDDNLFDALSKTLDLLYDYRNVLKFTPRVHPFNAQ